jgi:hypothetical protein
MRPVSVTLLTAFLCGVASPATISIVPSEFMTSVGMYIENSACSAQGTSRAACSTGGTEEEPDNTLMAFTASGIAEGGPTSLYSEVLAQANGRGAGFNVVATSSASYIVTIRGGTGIGWIDYVIAGLWGGPSDSFSSKLLVQQDATQQEFDRLSSMTAPYSLETQLFPFTYDVPFSLTLTAIARTTGLQDNLGYATTSLHLAEKQISTVPEPAQFLVVGVALILIGLASRGHRRGQP